MSPDRHRPTWTGRRRRIPYTPVCQKPSMVALASQPDERDEYLSDRRQITSALDRRSNVRFRIKRQGPVAPPCNISEGPLPGSLVDEHLAIGLAG